MPRNPIASFRGQERVEVRKEEGIEVSGDRREQGIRGQGRTRVGRQRMWGEITWIGLNRNGRNWCMEYGV